MFKRIGLFGLIAIFNTGIFGTLLHILTNYLYWFAGLFILPVLFLCLNVISDVLHYYNLRKYSIFFIVILNYFLLVVGYNFLNYFFLETDYFPSLDIRIILFHLLISIVYSFCLSHFSLLKLKRYKR